MSQAALILTLLFPLALAAGLAVSSLAGPALRLAPWAAAPALAVALLAPDTQIDLPWLLIGARLGLDETARIFLLLTAGLWTFAGIYAGAYHADDDRRWRYFLFHLITLAGNLGLVIAQDAASFYLFFVTMSFAAYGMVVHAGTGEALRAGRVYIVLVIIGEALILPGLWSAVAHAPGLSMPAVAAGALEAGPLTIAFLLLGFGIKAGLVPLHLWLPLAHPAAPTPASAVLSGAMIKAGVLAWIGVLPHAEAGFSGFGAALVIGGFVNAFFGAVVGVCQHRPKTVLAYSSISQIGLIMIAVGLGFLGGEAGAAALFAAAIYCLHHAAAKGALFLGVGIAEHSTGSRHRLALAAMLIPALALVGAPLTTGFAAKLALKDAAYALPAHAGTAEILIGLVATGTTLLMARFLLIVARRPGTADDAPAGMWLPWLGLIGAGLLLAWLPGVPTATWPGLVDPAALWSILWPVLAGIALAVLAALLARRGYRLPAIPEGDIVVPATRLVTTAGRGLHALSERRSEWLDTRRRTIRSARRRGRRRFLLDATRLERTFIRGPVIGLNLLGLIALLLVAFLLV